jgi:hypothetical protein
MNETVKDNIEYQAGATLINDGITFDVQITRGWKKRFTIRPLHPGTIVKMSQQVTMLEPVSESENMIQEMMARGKNIRPISRILAYAVLNGRFKIALFGRLLSALLMWRVESMEYMLAYMTLAYRQMGAQHFFFIMALTKGMNFLEKKTTAENTGEAKPSGAASQ